MIVSVAQHFTNTVMYICTLPAITVNFSQSSYSANENEVVQLMLVMSNPSSSSIAIRVDTIDREATGEALRGPCIAWFSNN